MAEHVIALLPKQLRFVMSTAREVSYTGGMGSGKSLALCTKLVTRAAVKGSCEGLCRKWLVNTRDTCLKTLLRGDGGLPPVLPQGSYHHNQTGKVISIYGGGEIHYFGLDDPQKIRSKNLSGCAIDEAVQLTETDYMEVMGRVRAPIQGMRNQIYWSSNPDAPSHHLAVRFGLAGNQPLVTDYELITTKASDNPFLPDDYLTSLKALGGIAKHRYFDGEWVAAEGMVYPEFNRNIHLKSRFKERDCWKRLIVACDYGVNHPFAMIPILQDNDNNLHVPYIEVHSGITHDKMYQYCLAVEKHCECSVESYVIDPGGGGAGLSLFLKEQGLPCRTAKKSVQDGIFTVAARLQAQTLTIEPTCERLIKEFESYAWNKSNDKKITDQPVNVFDDAISALRYGIVEYDGYATRGHVQAVHPQYARNDKDKQLQEINDARLWREL